MKCKICGKDMSAAPKRHIKLLKEGGREQGKLYPISVCNDCFQILLKEMERGHGD